LHNHNFCRASYSSSTPTGSSGSINSASVHSVIDDKEKKVALHGVGVDNPAIVVDEIGIADEDYDNAFSDDTPTPTQRDDVM